MTNIRQPIPCATSIGETPFAVISYSHADWDLVKAEIDRLHDLGCRRTWHDENIAPGSQWRDEIARAITGAAIFIVFISQNSIQSPNVINEIDFAIDKNKRFLAVYLEEVSLPPGLELIMGGIQAILKWSMTEKDYLQKLMQALPVECFWKSRNIFAPGADDQTVQELQMTDSFGLVPGGNFRMGSPENEADRSANETQHQVKIHNFYMLKHPVTVAQFEIFISQENYRTDADQDGGCWILDGQGYKPGVNWRYNVAGTLQKDKNQPVIYVSWNDAMAYCKWLSEKLKKTFRLPTEAEWEYACRAGTITPFHTGANLTTDQANYNGNYPYQNNPIGKYIAETTPVGHYPPNGWSLYDMHGNVYEWCLDWYADYYYELCANRGITDNPQGPISGTFRVLRGGGWNDDGRGCRSARRNSTRPNERSSGIGFRLVFVP